MEKPGKAMENSKEKTSKNDGRQIGKAMKGKQTAMGKQTLEAQRGGGES